MTYWSLNFISSGIACVILNFKRTKQKKRTLDTLKNHSIKIALLSNSISIIYIKRHERLINFML